MSLVVDLPPEVETRVREAAQAEGIDVSAYVYETVAPRLRRVPLDALRDTELMAKAREDFPNAFWKRFAALTAKRDAGELAPDEWRELVSSAEAVEAHDAERLYYLVELSQRRGESVRTLMAELDLRSGKDA